jgi:hypothetical protein
LQTPMSGPLHVSLVRCFEAGFIVAGSAPFKTAGGAGHNKTLGAGAR